MAGYVLGIVHLKVRGSSIETVLFTSRRISGGTEKKSSTARDCVLSPIPIGTTGADPGMFKRGGALFYQFFGGRGKFHNKKICYWTNYMLPILLLINEV